MPTQSKIDKLSTALALVNVALPNVVSLVATLSDGQQIDLKKLLDDTDKKLADIMISGRAFLELPDPAGEVVVTEDEPET